MCEQIQQIPSKVYLEKGPFGLIPLKIEIQLCVISKETDRHNSLQGISEGRFGAPAVTCAEGYNFHPMMLPLEDRETCFGKMHDLACFVHKI